MKSSIAGALGALALVFVAAGGAAPPIVTLASPGPSPFASCTADQANVQQQLGSTLYPNSEIEPRSTRFGSTIVAEYQQDRWSDGGARGLVTSVSHDNGATWKRVTVPGSRPARAARSCAPPIRGSRSRRRGPVRDLAELPGSDEPESQRDPRVEVDRPRRIVGCSHRRGRGRHQRARQGVDHR